MNKLFLPLIGISLACILVGCSDEGVTEGMINGMPIRFTDENVQAVQGIPTNVANPNASYALMPGVMPPQSLSIIIGDNYNAKRFRQRLSIFVFDTILYAVISSGVFGTSCTRLAV